MRVGAWTHEEVVLAELILGPMLRHVSETSATIWVETDSRCTVQILGRSVTTFCVAGHHYALAIIDDLEPASSIDYDVRLDGVVRWPPTGSTLPASRIRTTDVRGAGVRDEGDRGGGGRATRIVFGSCRTAAPHEGPWCLQLELDSRGRGVDALYTYALSMIEHPADQWPDLVVFLGDQIYADDSSPKARELMAQARGEANDADPDSVPPPELVRDFEEYTMLYHESWSPEIERWFFSNVPSVMIFDDHEMVDDWNISDEWVRDIREKPWWEAHVTGGLMTYWLYQHLGNLSPETIKSEGLLDQLGQLDDGEQLLRAWSMKSEEYTPVPGHYSFNFIRDIGRIRLVMIDSRNGRVLQPGGRRMVDADEWKWVIDSCKVDLDHLLIGTSLPLFVPIGLHDLQVWSERICDGAWGRPGRSVGQWLRVKADLEDWPSFSRSFDAFVELLGDLADASRGAGAPATISVLSGDIPFSFASEIRFPGGRRMASRVHQLVSSPIRNALTGSERTAMRLGTSGFARILGRLLRRGVHRKRPEVLWDLDVGPVFANSLAQLDFDGRSARMSVLKAPAHDVEARPQLERAIDFDLVAGSRAARPPAKP